MIKILVLEKLEMLFKITVKHILNYILLSLYLQGNGNRIISNNEVY